MNIESTLKVILESLVTQAEESRLVSNAIAALREEVISQREVINTVGRLKTALEDKNTELMDLRSRLAQK